MATKKKEDELKTKKVVKKEEPKKVEEEKTTPLAILEFIGIIIAIIGIEVFFQGTAICNVVTLLLMLTIVVCFLPST